MSATLTPALEKQLRDSIERNWVEQEGTLSYNLAALFREIDSLRYNNAVLQHVVGQKSGCPPHSPGSR